jgi:hypothetical protein
MHMWRLTTCAGSVIAAVWLAGCAPVATNPPSITDSATEVEPGPEAATASQVPELLAQRKRAATPAGGPPHAPPMFIKVANSAVQPPRERLQIVQGSRPSREESRRWMRRETLESPRVRQALGPRFALLDSGWMDDEKDDSTAPRDRYQLVFYNYARNEVVTVVTTGNREPVSLESSTPDVQPAESREEVDAAVEIVRRDPRYANQVANLHGRGILTPAPGRERHLYLLFYDGPRATPARFQATVNMSSGRIVEAKALK